MLSRKNPEPQGDPDDILYGTCATCGHEVQSLRRVTAIVKAEAGAWFDLPVVECPVCKARSPNGSGPKVYLRLKRVAV